MNSVQEHSKCDHEQHDYERYHSLPICELEKKKSGNELISYNHIIIHNNTRHFLSSYFIISSICSTT